MTYGSFSWLFRQLKAPILFQSRMAVILSLEPEQTCQSGMKSLCFYADFDTAKVMY